MLIKRQYILLAGILAISFFISLYFYPSAQSDANKVLKANTIKETGPDQISAHALGMDDGPTPSSSIESRATHQDAVPQELPASVNNPSAVVTHKFLKDGRLEVIFNEANNYSAPVRTRQLFRQQLDSADWSFDRQERMAANSFLIRNSAKAKEVLKAQSSALEYEPIGTGDWMIVRFGYEAQVDGLGEWLEFTRSTGIEAEPNYQVQVAELFSNDPLFQSGQQRHFDGLGQVIEGTLGISSLWERQTDASSVTVAILDTGIRSTHNEFTGQIWNNSGEIPGNGIDDDGNGYIDDRYGYDFVNEDPLPADDHGHGTHLAGLIGASGNNGTGMAGVAWQASLMPLKVLDSKGNGYVADIVEGINYAVHNGSGVMLLAFQTGSDSAALRTAFQAAQDADLVWAVPAGNNAASLMESPVYPAVYPFAHQITVGSHDLDAQYSLFSNYGIDHVDLSAPGSDILSTGIASDSSFVRKTGTSQSAALVTGVLAHVRTAFPSEPGWRSIQRLKDASGIGPRSTLKRTPDRKDYVASGRLNAAAPQLFGSNSTPGNDNIEAAWKYESPAFVTSQILQDATSQTGEPNHAGLPTEATVWYRWTPRQDGQVTLHVDHPSVSLAAYTWAGTITTLQAVATSLPSESGASISFNASAKTNYQIALNAPNGTAGVVQLELSQVPENYAFASAARISDDNFSTSAEIKGFLSPAARNNWYLWTAPTDGTLLLKPRSDLTAELSAYQVSAAGSLGSKIDTLAVREGKASSGLSFETQAGQSYAIQWSNPGNGNGYVRFGGNYLRAPEQVRISLTRMGYLHDPDDPNPLIAPENPDTVLWGYEALLNSRLAGGSSPLSFEWYFNGQLVLRGRNLYIPMVTESWVGTYVVKVTNPFGTVSSEDFELKVLAPPPGVRLSPDVITRAQGGSARVYANISNASIINNVKWYLNNVLIQDSSSRELELTNLQSSDSGVLRAVVSNAFGSARSQEVIVTVTANPLENWKRILPDTPGLNLDQAFYAGGRFFATGLVNFSANTLYTSPDGENWNQAVFNAPLDFITGIAYGNEVYVAVGKRNSSGAIASSTDGVFWTLEHEELGSYTFSSVSFGNGKFVTKRTYPSPGTNFFTSADGKSWSTTKYSPAVLGAPIHFGNGTFLISQSGVHYTSTNGTTWTANAVPAGGPSRTGSVTFHDGYFYKISGTISTMGLYHSANGIDWEVLAGPGFLGVRDNEGLYYDGQYFIVPSSNGPYISSTGTGFTRYTGNLTGSSIHGKLGDLAVGDGTIVGIEANGRIMHGSVITDLSFDDILYTGDFHRLEAFDDAIIAIGDTAIGFFGNYSWSRDGISWNIDNHTEIDDITKWNGTYYAAREASKDLIYSNDLKNWTALKDQPGAVILVASGNDRLVALLDGGMVSSTTDGIDWSAPTATDGATDTPKILRFLNGEFWLVRDSALYRSPDGISWTTSNLSKVRDITYANGTYIAGYGPNFSIYQSSDGSNWADIGSDSNLLAGRLKANGNVILGSNFDKLLYSEDSSNWTQITIEKSSTDVAFFNNAIFYVGDGGLMYRHGDPLPAPRIDVDLVQILSRDLLYVGQLIQFPYEASSINESVQVTLYVDGREVDSSNDGTPLEWAPESPGAHEVRIEVVDSNGLKQIEPVIRVNVRQGSARMVANPTALTFTAVLGTEDRVWIGTETGELYTRKNGATQWQQLELSSIDRIHGMVEGPNGGKYLYGSVFDAFGKQRGVVVFSQDGIFWERLGSLLEFSVLDVLATETGILALTKDANNTSNIAPSQLFARIGGEDWASLSPKDTLRTLVSWRGLIYAQDYFGNIQVSEDGVEWSEDFNSGSFDTGRHILFAGEDALVLAGRSRIYHNRINGQDWGYDTSHNVATVIDGIAYIATNDGVFRLTPEGDLLPSDRFATLSTGALETITATATSGEEVYLKTSTGRIVQVTANAANIELNTDHFSAHGLTLVEGVPFRVDTDGRLSTLQSGTNWSSASLRTEAANKNMLSFAFGNDTALFVGDGGVYRHNVSDDSWSLLPNTENSSSITFSDGRFWLMGYSRADYSDDNGATWTSFFSALETTIGSSLVRGIEIFADGDRVAIKRTSNVLFSSDRGTTWRDVGLEADSIAFTANDLVICGGTYNERLMYLENGTDLAPIERFPFGLSVNYFKYLSNWAVQDYLLNGGVEYLVASGLNEIAILSRQPGGEWKLLLHPTPSTSAKSVFYQDGISTYLATDQSIYNTALHNIEVTLSTTEITSLGVGDSKSVQVHFTNMGAGPAPAKENVSIVTLLQPSGTTSLSASVEIGKIFVDLPALAEGQQASRSTEFRIPNTIQPGSYSIRIAAYGLGDAYFEDNVVTAELESVLIPPRTVNLEARGSGFGSVVNLDPRESYPDNFVLPLLINPDPGYVYSAGPAAGDSINAASLSTVILDGSFDGKIYFEPSYSTWASAQISSPAERGRDDITGGGNMPNIFKYLLGHDASAAHAIAPFEILEDTQTNEKFIQFRIARGREGEPFTLNSTADLNEWNSMTPESSFDGDWLLFESSIPETLKDVGFFRLETP